MVEHKHVFTDPLEPIPAGGGLVGWFRKKAVANDLETEHSGSRAEDARSGLRPAGAGSSVAAGVRPSDLYGTAKLARSAPQKPIRRLRTAMGSNGVEIERLVSEIQNTRVELNKCFAGARTTPSQQRALAAQQHLADAQQNLGEGMLQAAWHSLHAANRELLACDLTGARRARMALRAHVNKISDRRAEQIIALLDTPQAEGCGPYREIECILNAIELRDDYFETNYWRMLIRRRQVQQVTWLLWMSLVVFSMLCWCGSPAFVARIVLFGVFGACVSVCQGLLRSEVSVVTISAQQAAACRIWARPAIGAVAALAAVALLHTQTVSDPDHALSLAVAFSAGFSERFIVGTIDRFTQSQKDPGIGPAD